MAEHSGAGDSRETLSPQTWGQRRGGSSWSAGKESPTERAPHGSLVPSSEGEGGGPRNQYSVQTLLPSILPWLVTALPLSLEDCPCPSAHSLAWVVSLCALPSAGQQRPQLGQSTHSAIVSGLRSWRTQNRHSQFIPTTGRGTYC